MKIGYIRVSTDDQNLERQEQEMKNIGVERIFSDKCSGKTMAREQYQAMRLSFDPAMSSISMPWIASEGTILKS
jgi:DNA invertase Pin-like site-specific DNA recombinase